MLANPDLTPRPPYIPRKQLRDLKRNARSQAYRSGKHADPINETMERAAAKRERSKLKRKCAALNAVIGQMRSNERLNGEIVL